jgi:hypothetical protein
LFDIGISLDTIAAPVDAGLGVFFALENDNTGFVVIVEIFDFLLQIHCNELLNLLREILILFKIFWC